MANFSQYGGVSDGWRAVQAAMPVADPGLSLLEKQAKTNAWREAHSAAHLPALADQIVMADHAIPARDGATVEGRTYRPKTLAAGVPAPVYIHLHGGGYVFGTLASEDAGCAQIAVRANVVVLNVNYRHAPAVAYPVPLDDVQDALLWLHAQAGVLGVDPARVVVGGISAGAHLAASLVLEQHLGRLPGLPGVPVPPLAGQVLFIPCLVHLDCYGPQLARLASPAVSSTRENADAPLLSYAAMRLFTDLLHPPGVRGGPPAEDDTKASPGNAAPAQVRGLPPTVVGVCGLDFLRDDGLLYGTLLAGEGVPTNVHVFKGVPHGFRRYAEDLSVSKAWDEAMEQGIVWALSRPAARPFAVTVHE